MHAVLVSMMVVAANVRAIEAYLRELEGPLDPRTRLRQRPKDYQGYELRLLNNDKDDDRAA